jgi:hypothetical protein
LERSFREPDDSRHSVATIYIDRPRVAFKPRAQILPLPTAMLKMAKLSDKWSEPVVSRPPSVVIILRIANWRREALYNWQLTTDN